MSPSLRHQCSVVACRPAPTIEVSEADMAISKLNERGGDHSQLVQTWGSDFGQNLAYAKTAFREIAATNPDLIAKLPNCWQSGNAAKRSELL